MTGLSEGAVPARNSPTAAAATASDPLATPDFFPTAINAERGTLKFVQMSRVCFRQSAFLDRRIVRPNRTTLTVDIARLATRRRQLPLLVILHGAFCGSTLLARYLEALPHCLVLKEPELLAQLSVLHHKPPPGLSPELWTQWFRIAMAMLSRGYPDDAAVLVKPADMVNWMGHRLLDDDCNTRLVFLHSPLRTFLLQALKVEHRRQWLRQHVQWLGRSMTQVPFLAGITTAELTDGECAAAMWLLNSFLCHSLMLRTDAHRVMPINGDDLLLAPMENALAAAAFLGLLHDPADHAAIARNGRISYHAKDARIPYDTGMRAAELAEAEARFGNEVAAAVAWAQAVSQGWLNQSPFAVA